MRWLVVLGLLGGCDALFQLDHVPDPDGGPDAPVAVGRWTSAVAGDAHTCAIDVDQHLWCWGRNLSGEAGAASNASQIDSAQQVTDSQWAQVSAHFRTTCGIKVDGSLWCWGRNSEGQVGIGTLIDVDGPVQVPGTWLEVSVGGTTTCGLADDHSLKCWGANNVGQVGDGTTTTRTMPVPVDSTARFAHIATGGYSLFNQLTVAACAIDMTGQLFCWGGNDYGQLGTGSTGAYVASPTLVSAGPWDSISAGFAFFCGTTTGKLRCWGMNQHGQVGDVSLASHNAPSPVTVSGIVDGAWADVTAGVLQACARTMDGRLFCWGGSDTGQLQIESPAVAPTEFPAPAGFSGGWLGAATGDRHTCALATDHTLWCVGGDGYGQLGDGGTSTNSPVHVADGYSMVSAGERHTCAATALGMTSCAGNNNNGELGIASTADKQNLTSITGPMFTALSGGRFSTCGLSGQQAWCWGDNLDGQIATGDMTDATIPRVSHAAVSVSASFHHACAIDVGAAKPLYCWGRGDNGQVGNKVKSIAAVTAPFQIPTQSWADVATGYRFTCGIDTGKVVRCWGDNTYGQLASGNLNEDLNPADPSLLSGVDRIYAGAYHACATDALNHLSCWGRNSSGQLGTGTTTTQQASPVLINQSGWRTVSLGWYHTCGIQTDNSLWCWGDNERGQLGIGSRAPTSSPAQVGADHDWSTVSTKLDHTCATKMDGSLWCWGNNSDGQLANGTAWRTSLVQAP